MVRGSRVKPGVRARDIRKTDRSTGEARGAEKVAGTGQRRGAGAPRTLTIAEGENENCLGANLGLRGNVAGRGDSCCSSLLGDGARCENRE
jgi:hypothetical protein